MSEKHTPGPWRWTAGRTRVKVLAAGMPVASVTSDRAEEDARLIAAAPDLLAALAECADAMEGQFGPALGCGACNRPSAGAPKPCPAHRRIEAARAAIAKAVRP